MGEETEHRWGPGWGQQRAKHQRVTEGRAGPDQELRMGNEGSGAKPKGAFMRHSGFGALSRRQ